MSNLISTDNNAHNSHFLIFSLDDKQYAVNIENVLEIIKVPALDVPQKMPKHILGVMTYNNISVNINDLRSVLSFPIRTYSADSQVIIVKTEEAIFGFLADKVLDVTPLKTENIQPLPYHSEDNLIKFLYRLHDTFISVINLNSVQNVIQKTQFEQSEFDVTALFPQDKETKAIMLKRQTDLIQKFQANIEQIYFDQEQFVIFSLNENLYALSIKSVKEIVKYKNISSIKLPTAYDYIEGIFNLRGDFISVLNFKKFLNNQDATIPENSMLIVLEVKDFKIAILVDNIFDITTVSQNEIISKFNDKFESKYVVSELHFENNIVSVISLDKLFADERLYIRD